MKVAILGLGYVGAVAAGCLAEGGHDVVAVDIDPTKITLLNAGQSPIKEPGLDELVARNVSGGRLAASADLSSALRGRDVIIICVGTPSSPSGDVRLDDLDRVVDQVGATLRLSTPWPLVMLTSTVPPGTTEGRVIPRLEQLSGKTCGHDFSVAFSPEFLREGSAVHDYMNPAKTVVGATDPRGYSRAAALLDQWGSEIISTSIPVAEMIKLTDNSWHALKVTFTNEISRLCASLRVDSYAVMKVFASDTRLNISPAYMDPGFAFGGSCLPKDLRTLVYRARQRGIDVPVLEAVLPSNRAHVDAALRAIQEFDARRIALLGVAFKSGTDDLRESPMLDLAEQLLGRGYELAIHDEYVDLDRFPAGVRKRVETRLSHITPLLTDNLEVAVKGADLIVIAQSNPSYAGLCEWVTDRPVLDLAGVARTAARGANYRGLAW